MILLFKVILLFTQFFPTCNMHFSWVTIEERERTNAWHRSATCTASLRRDKFEENVLPLDSSSFREAASRLAFTAPRLSRSPLIRRKNQVKVLGPGYSYFRSMELSNSSIDDQLLHNFEGTLYSEENFQISLERNCDSLIKTTHDALLVDVYVAHHKIIKIIQVQRKRKFIAYLHSHG